jgi:hypothetical protein
MRPQQRTIVKGPYAGRLLTDPIIPDEVIFEGYDDAMNRLSTMNSPHEVCWFNPYRDMLTRGEIVQLPTWGWVRTHNPGYWNSVHSKIQQELAAYGAERERRLARQAEGSRRTRHEEPAGNGDALFSQTIWDRIEAEQIDVLIADIFHEGYRRRALRAHPDQGGSQEEMNRVNFAKEVLITFLNYFRSDEG